MALRSFQSLQPARKEPRVETTITNATGYHNVSLSLLKRINNYPRRIFGDAALKT